MYPELLRLGPFTLHSYGFFLALGAGLGLWLASRLAKESGLDPEKVSNLAMWCLLIGVVGSRLVFVALEPEPFLREPWRVFYFWEGGLVFYGGIALALPLGLGLARRWGLPTLGLLDCVAPALALGELFGRFGCFSAGCCFGQAWNGPWAVTFTHPRTLAPPNVSLHPTQLYTALELALILALLLWLWPRRRFAGQIFFVYGLTHGLGRVVIEQFRADWRGEPLFLGLTPTALFALALALVSAGMLFFPPRPAEPDKRPRSPRQPPGPDRKKRR